MPQRPHSPMAARLARLFAHALAAMVVLAPSASLGASAPLAVALEYSVPPGCPDASEFKSIVVGRLGYGAFREDVPDRALVHVVAHGRTFDGRIEWRDAAGRWQGERTFPSRAGDCPQLIRAMAFALALQIQLLATAATSPEAQPPAQARTEEAATAQPSPAREEPPAPEESPPPTLPPPVTATPEAEAPKVPSRPLGFAVGVGALATLGVSTDVTPFARVFGSVARGALSLEVAVELGPASTIRREDGAGFSHRELLAALAACGAVDRWSACLVGKGGQIRIDGKGIDWPASTFGPYLQTGLRLAVRQDLGSRFFLRAQAEGLVTMTRATVTLDDHSVWTAQRFAGTLGLDLGVRFR